MCSPKIQNNKKNNSATQCTEIIFFVPGILGEISMEKKKIEIKFAFSLQKLIVEVF